MSEASVEVLAAAARLVGAFGSGDTEGYFRCFAPDASFVFHSIPERLGSTAAYRSAWAGWEQALDLRIRGCESFDQEVRIIAADVALFIHSVRVHARTQAGDETRQERETIVFVKQADGHWLGVHEHLSKNPAP